jgi:pyruvate dehydrogenase E1 component alpha subunit
MSDPAKYRSKEEVEDYKEHRDAITHFREYLLSEKIANEAALKKIDDEIKVQINDAAEFAKTSPEPDATELWTDILSQ